MLRRHQREVVAEMIRSAVPLYGVVPATAHKPPRAAAAANSHHHDGGDATVWKVLIYDARGRDILAPLVKVKELREMGVTLHLMIDKPRTEVPGVPAIYFCEPTEENIGIICRDCAKGLYQATYVNFLSQVSRPLLEYFAQGLLPLTHIESVKVFDRTLSYCALDNDFFSILESKSFRQINSARVSESAIEAHLNSVVLGLSHVMLTLNVLPIIAHVRTGAAEETAQRARQKINDLLQEQLLKPNPSAGRPLLLIVDRSYDLSAALHHPFSYRGLLVDALGMHLNKVDLLTEEGPKTFELDSEVDTFYVKSGGRDFSGIAEEVDLALAAYKKDYAQLTASEGDAADIAESGASVAKLLAIAPQLAERKKMVDAHTSLAYACLRKIKEFELDGFHGVEHGLITREGLDMDHLKKLLAGKGRVSDKQRVFLIAYLLADGPDQQKAVEEQLQLMGQDVPFPALHYLKKLQNWTAGSNQNDLNSSAASGWKFYQNLAKNITKTIKGSTDSNFPVTRLVDALLQDPLSRSALQSKVVEGIGAFDPRTNQPLDIVNVRFSQAFVFVVGGGSMPEYDNIKEWEQRNPRKSVLYGCTEVVTGEGFLDQLSQLGSE